MVAVRHVHDERADRLQPQPGVLACMVAVRGGTFLFDLSAAGVVAGTPAVGAEIPRRVCRCGAAGDRSAQRRLAA